MPGRAGLAGAGSRRNNQPSIGRAAARKSDNHGMDLEKLRAVKSSAVAELQALSKTVDARRSSTAGPYAFFAHNAHALEGLEDIDRILTRLFDGRGRLTQLSHDEDALQAQLARTDPIPEEMQRLLQAQHELTGYMKMDLESLYVFGGVLLDQWAMQLIYLAGLMNRSRRKKPFVGLVDVFESAEQTFLDPVREAVLRPVRWLYWQLRFYRNRFIIHSDRPWQRGTTRSLQGTDFNLFTPSPPGWLSEAEESQINQEVYSYLPLAPKAIRDAPDDYWQKKSARALLEVLFNHIAEIENAAKRERIAHLFGRVGGALPTFQILASNLLSLVRDGTAAVNSVAAQIPADVDLGAPAGTVRSRLKSP